MKQIFADWFKWIRRLRFGGSASAPTAGVLACQWNNVLKTILGESRSRQSPAAEDFSRKERKGRKEMKEV